MQKGDFKKSTGSLGRNAPHKFVEGQKDHGISILALPISFIMTMIDWSAMRASFLVYPHSAPYSISCLPSETYVALSIKSAKLFIVFFIIINRLLDTLQVIMTQLSQLSHSYDVTYVHL